MDERKKNATNFHYKILLPITLPSTPQRDSTASIFGLKEWYCYSTIFKEGDQKQLKNNAINAPSSLGLQLHGGHV